MTCTVTAFMERPKIRKVDRFEQRREGEHLLIVRDPLEVANPFAIDAAFAPVLDLLDGTRTVSQIRQSLRMRGLLDVPLAELQAFILDLQEAGVLDDGVFRSRWSDIHEAFLASSTRESRLAGMLYPNDPEELKAMLEDTLPGATKSSDDSTLAVVGPHGPPAWVAPVLVPLFERLPPPAPVELIVILGTDHGRGLLPYAVTAKNYATPLGVAHTDAAFVEALERRLDWIRREEIRHRQALSIELTVLYLQHVYGASCPPIVPVLCGSSVFSPGQRAAADRFVADLETLAEGRRVLWWASAELSHGGPAYGRDALRPEAEAELRAYDQSCLNMLLQASPERFERCALDATSMGPASGAAAMATLLRLLPVGSKGSLVGYEQVPPPGQREGLAGIATAVFTS